MSKERAQGALSSAVRVLRQLAGMDTSPAPDDLDAVAAKYHISPGVVEDLYARRRAGARDAELINLLGQQDRGGLTAEQARALVAELPPR
jgi:hypothetical protein